MRVLFHRAVCIAICFLPTTAWGDASSHQVIDQWIEKGLPKYAQLASPITDDDEFLRRVTLDLHGTIPSATEVRVFRADKNSNKRQLKIEQLLASDWYALRMRIWFDVLMMDRRNDLKVSRASWETYLYQSFHENKPYDQLVREMLANDGADPKNRAPAKFLLDRELEPNLVTRDISRLFLGKNMQCAQCHDHPLVSDYKQEHYYGILAFFNRSYMFPSAQDAKAALGEKAEGEVSFTSVFDKAKTQKTTMPRVPNLAPIIDQKLEKGKEYKTAPDKTVRGVPNYSRREKLAAALTSPDNKSFARTAVNRFWAMMMGRGLVHPLDMDHGENPASHPELLDYLTNEFIKNKYDVKWLLRELALTKTYQRSSVVKPEAKDIHADRYLAAIMKPLSPEQFGFALLQAAGYTDWERSVSPKGYKETDLMVKLMPHLVVIRNKYSPGVGIPEEGFSSTLDQVLYFKHNGQIRSFVTPREGNLVMRAMKLPQAQQQAEELYTSVFGRPGSVEEYQEIASLINASKDKVATLQEIIWAMLATAEFRFNH